MMKLKFIKTVHLMSSAVILAALGLAVYAFLWFHLGFLSDESAKLEGDLRVAVLRSQSAVSLEKSLHDAAISRLTVDSYFLPAKGTVSFVEFVESLGRVAGTKVSIKSIGVDEGGAEDFKDVLSVAVDVYGNWNSLMNFLSLIESAPYHVDISSADIDKSATKSSNEWHALVTVKVLQLK